jgi:hypothetical protein
MAETRDVHRSEDESGTGPSRPVLNPGGRPLLDLCDLEALIEAGKQE